MTPAYQPLQCSNGICGTILSEKSSSCAVDCSSITMCSKCVENPTCGWCALGGLNGIGVCMAGGLHGPKYGLCSAVNVTLGDKPLPGKNNRFCKVSVLLGNSLAFLCHHFVFALSVQSCPIVIK